jgi:hypothetical protein
MGSGLFGPVKDMSLFKMLAVYWRRIISVCLVWLLKCEIIAEFLIKCQILAIYWAVLKAHFTDVCCEDGNWVSPQPESCSVAGIKGADSADTSGNANVVLFSLKKMSEVGLDTRCFRMCLSKHVKY